jgi:hypothetical protein
VGYLPGFDEDVFISYAHNDDDTYATETSGWVAQLHSDLDQRVKVHLGAKLRMWRDCEIRNNDDFAKKIPARLIRTATFLSIISPSFMRREWCLRELEEFAAHAQRNEGVLLDDEKSRIFKVEKIPVDRHTLPSQLQGTGSYKFHGADPARPGREHEFRPFLGGEYSRRYFEEMDELAKDIATVMLGMAEKPAAGVEPGATARGVYLAETSSDLDPAASEIRRDLKSRGYLLFPQGDLPYRAKDFSAKAREYLARSVLSVHLIGKEYGFVPEGEAEKSNAWLQSDLALERAQDSAFLRLIWMPPGVAPADGRQQRFVEYLTQDAAVQKGADVLETSLEDLKTAILESLAKVERELQQRRTAFRAPAAAPSPAAGSGAAPAETAAPAADDEPLRIYLICDQLDRKSPDFLALRKFLFSQGYEPLLASESGAEADPLEEHAENLAICDACLIYYGRGSANWFHAKLMDLRKNLARRERPVFAKGVYLAPPESDDKSEFETHEALVLRGGDSFSPDPLAPFVQRIAAVSADKKR